MYCRRGTKGVQGCRRGSRLLVRLGRLLTRLGVPSMRNGPFQAQYDCQHNGHCAQGSKPRYLSACGLHKLPPHNGIGHNGFHNICFRYRQHQQKRDFDDEQLRVTGTAHDRLLRLIVLEVSPTSAHWPPPSEHSVQVHCVASAWNVPRTVRLDDFVEVRGMKVFSRLADRMATRTEGTSGPGYERRFRAPERPFSMGPSRIPNTDHEHAMWKQNLHTAEQESP